MRQGISQPGLSHEELNREENLKKKIIEGKEEWR